MWIGKLLLMPPSLNQTVRTSTGLVTPFALRRLAVSMSRTTTGTAENSTGKLRLMRTATITGTWAGLGKTRASGINVGGLPICPR